MILQAGTDFSARPGSGFFALSSFRRLTVDPES
jgi:hypothetical protein